VKIETPHSIMSGSKENLRSTCPVITRARFSVEKQKVTDARSFGCNVQTAVGRLVAN